MHHTIENPRNPFKIVLSFVKSVQPLVEDDVRVFKNLQQISKNEETSLFYNEKYFSSGQLAQQQINLRRLTSLTYESFSKQNRESF